MGNINTSLNLLEGLLISSHTQNPLAPALEKCQLIKDLIHALHEVVGAMKVTQPRFLHLMAYYNYIKGNIKKAYSFLKNAHDIASAQGNILEERWIQHTKMVWENPVIIQKRSHSKKLYKLENKNISIDSIQFYSFVT
ncbi:uncharacterized protein LOC126191582 [Schistocerca cancellata]|uniref:uncharacterized protein LOC126191582 n=1 Tax=Schistocerca cancellata TaxID=274614 RepID=UPI002117E25E|nr:uncharacterized protein LOC126191582 [Schistocerca cancellata]XP_049788473.1 uncharacterized protein LOC126191582 [Schistocerca cancellata]XP_049788475.1 uncharacterized protein LOC126191582 [Schistocerca cancellata]